MDWSRMLAYITGTVEQELLLRNVYLATENRILRAQINGRLLLLNAEKKTLANTGHRLGRQALEDVANGPNPPLLWAGIEDWSRASSMGQSHVDLPADPESIPTSSNSQGVWPKRIRIGTMIVS